MGKYPEQLYHSSILFWEKMYWLFIYASKYIFSDTTILKASQNWLKLLKTEMDALLMV